MKRRDITADLLHYTKQIAQKIRDYEAVVDFTEDSHWFNPFYRQSDDIVVIWADLPEITGTEI